MNPESLPSLQSFPWYPVSEQSQVGSLLTTLHTPPFRHKTSVPQRSLLTPALLTSIGSVLFTLKSVIHPANGTWSFTTDDVSLNAWDFNSGGIPPRNKWLNTVMSRLLDLTSTHLTSLSTMSVVFLKLLLMVTLCHWLSFTAVSVTTVAGSAQNMENRRLSLPLWMSSSKKSQKPSSSKYTRSPWELLVFILKFISLSQHAFHMGKVAHCPSAPVNSRLAPRSTTQHRTKPIHIRWAPCRILSTMMFERWFVSTTEGKFRQRGYPYWKRSNSKSSKRNVWIGRIWNLIKHPHICRLLYPPWENISGRPNVIFHWHR